MDLRVSSRDAASLLDELLDRVTDGSTVVIERNGLPIAKLISASDTKDAGKLMSADDAREVQRLLESGRSLNDGWAEGVEEAVRLGNQPMKLEDPWDH